MRPLLVKVDETIYTNNIEIKKLVIPSTVDEIISDAMYVGFYGEDHWPIIFTIRFLDPHAIIDYEHGIEILEFEEASTDKVLVFNYDIDPESYKRFDQFPNYGMTGFLTFYQNRQIANLTKLGDFLKANGCNFYYFKHVLKDGENYENTYKLNNATITYKRNFTSTNWQGMCLPFDIGLSDLNGGTAATLTNYENGVLTWTTVTSATVIKRDETHFADAGVIPAGKPFIYKPSEAGEQTFNVENSLMPSTEIISSTINGVTVSGTYAEKNMQAGEKYYWGLANGNFYYSTGEKMLKPYRIFLETNSLPQSNGGAMAPIRNRIVGENGDITYIGEIEGLDIVPNGKAYNLQGIEVGDDYKGIVIQNGKKTIRK